MRATETNRFGGDASELTYVRACDQAFIKRRVERDETLVLTGQIIVPTVVDGHSLPYRHSLCCRAGCAMLLLMGTGFVSEKDRSIPL
jgi:hypothetical protein